MIQLSLESLKKFFLNEGYEAQVEAKTDISPEQLVILFGRDTDGHDLLLHLSLLEEEGMYFLQFYTLFPYEIHENALNEMSRVVLSINASFDLANFGMIEGSKLFYYRYIHISERDALSEDVLRAITDSLSLLFETFLPSLTSVASGEKTVEDLQKETKEAIRKQEFEVL